MFETENLTREIENALNEIGRESDPQYSFKLFSEIGELSIKDADIITGVVKMREAVPVPLHYSRGSIVKYTYTVELVVPAVRSNYNVININKIINKLIESKQGSTEVLTVPENPDEQCTLTYYPGVSQRFEISYGSGDILPIAFTVELTMSDKVISSGSKVWKLDGEILYPLSESLTVQTEGITRKIYEEEYSKTLITGQTKLYTFRFPYTKELYAELQAELLNSANLGTVHTLEYSDGSAYPASHPYKTTVKIHDVGKSHSELPGASYFDVTFTDAYKADNKPYRYFLGLIDFPFDNQSEDTRFFPSTTAQRQYFEDKVNNGTAPFTEIEAPNLEQLYITRQVYTGNKTNHKSQFDFVNKNYAVIKVVEYNVNTGEPDTTETPTYFYYFITSAEIGASGQILLDLQLDTVQTYFFRDDVSFSDCMIERAHLNRFVPVGDSGKVTFATDPATKIYNTEQGLEFPKKIVRRDKLNLEFTGSEAVNEWLNNNVYCWVYIYLDKTHAYKLVDTGEYLPYKIKSKVLIDELNSSACLCFPIYKQDNKIQVRFQRKAGEGLHTFNINNFGYEWFIRRNDKSFFYNIKFSIVPPFDRTIDITNFAIDEGNLVISGANWLDGVVAGILKYNLWAFNTSPDDNDLNRLSGVFTGATQLETSIYTTNYRINNGIPDEGFTKEEIKKSTPNPKYNPKLLSQNFQELVITASNGETFSYDIQKLQKSRVQLLYTEPLQPEITKYYLRAVDTGLYDVQSQANYTGLVGSTDNGLAFNNDQYAEFIANNKNFWMQSNMKIVTNTAKGLLSAAGTQVGVKNTPEAQVKAGFGLAGNLVGIGIDLATSLIDRSLTIDNLKSAPDQLKNANGNVIFNMMVMDLGLYIEHYKALDGDLKTANDFMNLYGYTYSSVGAIREYVNIRKYHNYLKAQLQGIKGNMSNNARTDLRQRFANGIRFWNSDDINYNHENYENWLDE